MFQVNCFCEFFLVLPLSSKSLNHATALPQIIKDHSTGKSKGFGFVKMEDEESAEKAIQELQEAELRGRTLKISGAREKI